MNKKDVPSAGAPPSTNAAAEPWMRETHTDLDPLRRAVLHALELVGEDAERWCAQLTDDEIHARPSGLPPVAFHLRHIVRSLDRLLTYAEDGSLEERQLAALQSEMEAGEPGVNVLAELRHGLVGAQARVRSFAPESFGEARGIGRKRLPTTVGSLLIHCAEHSQRHIGQAVTTAKLLLAHRDAV